MIAALTPGAWAQPITIDFNDSASIAALSYQARGGEVVRGARYTFVPAPTAQEAYKEDGMVFLNGVSPPDPALKPIPQPHYHLSYENPDIDLPAMIRLGNPENEPRMISTHSRGAVIQLTYDPNNDGVPDPFRLISLDVLHGTAHVGVKSNDFGIGVYNDLTEGLRWFLIDANNLTRATIEVPFNTPVTIDNIVFEPMTGTAGGRKSATARAPGEFSDDNRRSEPLDDVPEQTLTPALHTVLELTDLTASPEIDIDPASGDNVLDLENQQEVTVAILSAPGFDAATIDPASVAFGPNSAREVQGSSRTEDVDGDGDNDLVLQFRPNEAGIACEDMTASVAGQLQNGTTFVGTDAVTTAGCCKSPAETEPPDSGGDSETGDDTESGAAQ